MDIAQHANTSYWSHCMLFCLPQSIQCIINYFVGKFMTPQHTDQKRHRYRWYRSQIPLKLPQPYNFFSLSACLNIINKCQHFFTVSLYFPLIFNVTQMFSLDRTHLIKPMPWSQGYIYACTSYFSLFHITLSPCVTAMHATLEEAHGHSIFGSNLFGYARFFKTSCGELTMWVSEFKFKGLTQGFHKQSKFTALLLPSLL